MRRDGAFLSLHFRWGFWPDFPGLEPAWLRLAECEGHKLGLAVALGLVVSANDRGIAAVALQSPRFRIVGKLAEQYLADAFPNRRVLDGEDKLDTPEKIPRQP